ncbi:hypothetical protein [Vibrio barjaei]|uniref:hypothetical protein n=1 Tax=Vibrio barjaei TaxID=1676683 RepID=UPI0022843C45|nr:hypothetical protein [Vibrio barjaei]MCY9874053.1 hypothetical protein [Vibrio barjaei]
MIINYNEVISTIDDLIKGYTTHRDYQSNKTWQTVVSGMERAKYEIEKKAKLRSTPSRAILDLNQEELKELQTRIENMLQSIDEEDKIKIYKLHVIGIDHYFSSVAAAKSALLTEFDDWVDETFDTVSIDIKPILIAPSELEHYHIVK